MPPSSGGIQGAFGVRPACHIGPKLVEGLCPLSQPPWVTPAMGKFMGQGDWDAGTRTPGASVKAFSVVTNVRPGRQRSRRPAGRGRPRPISRRPDGRAGTQDRSAPAASQACSLHARPRGLPVPGPSPSGRAALCSPTSAGNPDECDFATNPRGTASGFGAGGRWGLGG